MNRKKFLLQSGILAPFITAFNPLSAKNALFFEKILSQATLSDRILVLIQLNGGNDNLNTIIPVSQYDILTEVRKNILIPENKTIKLQDADGLGFHPALSGLSRLYNDKKLCIIQGVGYPNPDRSHMRATDIKLSGDCSSAKSKTGWIGRYLEKEYTNYPNNYPIHPTDGPPCMRIGEVSPKISQGTNADFSISISSLVNNNLSIPEFPDGVVSNNLGSKIVEDIRTMSKQVKLYDPGIKAAADRQKTFSKLYPEQGKNKLADQLSIVARLIGGGLGSRVYVVNQSGYDTHGDQVDRTDTTKGQHAKLLSDLSEAIVAFEDDLQLMGKQDAVLGMTFSEFGRRISSNDSYGTDHGSIETVLLFGSKLKTGLIGSTPKVHLHPSIDYDLPFQYDFRLLYLSILEGWFGVSEDKLKSIIPDSPSERLKLFT